MKHFVLFLFFILYSFTSYSQLSCNQLGESFKDNPYIHITGDVNYLNSENTECHVKKWKLKWEEETLNCNGVIFIIQQKAIFNQKEETYKDIGHLIISYQNKENKEEHFHRSFIIDKKTQTTYENNSGYKIEIIKNKITFYDGFYEPHSTYIFNADILNIKTLSPKNDL